MRWNWLPALILLAAGWAGCSPGEPGHDRTGGPAEPRKESAALPENWPADLAVPAQGTIFESAASPSLRHLVYSTPATLARTVAFHRRAMSDAGWTETRYIEKDGLGRLLYARESRQASISMGPGEDALLVRIQERRASADQDPPARQ